MNFHNNINNNYSTKCNSNIRRNKVASSKTSPFAIKKFRAAWSEISYDDILKETMTSKENERQNILNELFMEEQKMIELHN